MTCEVCGSGVREERLIRYNLSIPNDQGNDELIVIDHVPAIVCPNCGEVSFRPDVVETLQGIAWSKRKPSRVIEAPVYEFAS